MATVSRRTPTARLIATALASAALTTALPAHAQDALSPPAQAEAAPSESAMVNLVRQLVKSRVLTKAAGDALMAQALAEAQAARASAATQTAQSEPPAGTIRVPYVPQSVRDQIRDEIKGEVLAQARTGGWASPEAAAPDWTRRIRLYGDIRVRSQSELYSNGNTNQLIDFAAVNANGPLDLGVSTRVPFVNTRVDRPNVLRYRARLGVDIHVNDAITAGIRLASGDDNSPISTNAVLGGGFAKRDVWIDRAYFNIKPTSWSNVSFGRFANPFMSTELLFDDDLNFDGVAAEVNAGHLISDNLDIVLRGGAFPLDFGDTNFPSTNITKRKTADKYLFSAQIEAGGKIVHDVDVRLGAAYHAFRNVQGQLSDLCILDSNPGACSSDDTRPFFLRKGNTLFALRQNAFVNPQPAGTPAPQFYGLAFQYNILDLNGRVTIPVTDAIGVTLTGDYVRNLGFKRSDVCRNGTNGQPINNLSGSGDACTTGSTVRYNGGNTGWTAQARVGWPKVEKVGQWSAFASYRYLETDAVLDSFTDSDFHLGGTNAKGYIIGGNYGVYDNVTVGGRWLSSNEISGEPLAIDVLQVDLQVSF